jgi:two-component system sensor histidine kinase/response regulator
VREIRRQDRWSALPVVALTAQARVEDQDASLQAGMTAHLTKPIDETALYRTLIDVLGLAPDGGGGRAAAGERAIDDGADEVPQAVPDFTLAATLQRVGGEAARAERLLKAFLRDFGDAPQRLDGHLRERNVGEITLLVHTIKGSAGFFCAKDFYLAADRLERAGRNGDTEGIEAQAQEFRGRLGRLLADIGGGLAALQAGDGPAAP